MARRLWVLLLLLPLMGGTAAAQGLAPGYVDPAPLLAAASKAIGVDNLKCLTIAGTGYSGAVGQARESKRNIDWPRIDSLANYTRTMNWETRTMKEEFDRKPGLNPAGWKYGIGWVDGPLQQNLHQIFMVNGTFSWYMDGPASAPAPLAPEWAEIHQLEMWLNPVGFLKAARMPGANPRAVWRWELGEMGRDGPETLPYKMHVVAINIGKYRVDATINPNNMLQRIHTMVAEPALGDFNYEHEFTDDSYIDLGNGSRFPTGWHSHQGWDDNFQALAASAGHNAFGGQFKDVRANVCPDAVAVPESVRTANHAVRVETTKLADGVYLLGGGSHNSVAVEFANTVTVIEAPLNEARSLAVIEEVARLIPNKPIRFVVTTHQHFDHIGGLRTYQHIGATIVTQIHNFEFFNRDVVNYSPRSVAPDMVSLWPPTELSEGYVYELVTQNYVISDGTRQLNLHYVQPLQHVQGMLMAYLPRERLIIEADLFDTHPNAPTNVTPAAKTFLQDVNMLKLQPATIVPIHGKPVPWDTFLKYMGTAAKTN